MDDATRLAHRRALAHFRAHGIRVERVMSDNGSAYVSIVHALAGKTLGIKHLRTRPYPPRTNGKAERFIRTLLGGWAYGAIYGNSQERRLALTGWLDFYNRRRPHGSLNHQPPPKRLEALSQGTTRLGLTASGLGRTRTGTGTYPATSSCELMQGCLGEITTQPGLSPRVHHGTVRIRAHRVPSLSRPPAAPPARPATAPLHPRLGSVLA